MKKLNLTLTAFIGLLMTLSVSAQTKPDYYAGKWNVVVRGTPNGDAKMTFVIGSKEGKLAGDVLDSVGKELTKITSIEEKDKTVNIAFTAQGYDLTLTLDPVDADNVKGSLMGMFDATGVRVKENN